MSSQFYRRVALAQRITWASFGVLILARLGGGVVAEAPWTLQIIGIVPLLIFIPGMLRISHRSLALLCFVTLMYFTVIVVNLSKPNHSVFDAIAVVAVSSLFVAAMLLSRWIQYYRLEQYSAANGAAVTQLKSD